MNKSSTQIAKNYQIKQSSGEIAELNKEFAMWDMLSDEALLNMEKNL
jgi:hypothetical protein